MLHQCRGTWRRDLFAIKLRINNYNITNAKISRYKLFDGKLPKYHRHSSPNDTIDTIDIIYTIDTTDDTSLD